jgi:hypothetical protein
MSDDGLSPEAHLEITRRVFTETLRYQAQLINELNDNMTSTSERSSALLEEKRQLARDKLRLLTVLDSCRSQIEKELARGYVLTNEPLASLLWHKRWNDLLGEVEVALSRERWGEEG